jgi:hypothetical protein
LHTRSPFRSRSRSSGQTHWAEEDHFDIDTGDTGNALAHTFALPDAGGNYTIISDVQLSFSADPTCGSTVTTWVELKVASGNPVRVEDRIGSGEPTIGGAVKQE